MWIDRRLRLICPGCGEDLEKGRRAAAGDNEVACQSCGTLCTLTKPSRRMARLGARPAIKIAPTGSNAVHRMR